MGWLNNKIDEIINDYTSQLHFEIINKLSDFQTYMLVSIWRDILDLLLCIILIFVFYVCICMIFSRDTVSLPLLGEQRPVDHLYFLFCFYLILKLI